jgi:ribonuclease P protein component
LRWYGRLRRSGEIAFVRRRGRQAGFAGFSVFSAPGSAGSTVCISVSKAVGGAVVRNLVRRRIRGALDALPQAAPCRLLFVVKPAAVGLPFELLAHDVAAAVERSAKQGTVAETSAKATVVQGTMKRIVVEAPAKRP